MKRLVLLIAALAGVALALKRFGPLAGDVDIASRIEAMPDSAPPKWIYNNVTAIRANTDRIIELLERRRAAESGEQPPAEPDA